MKADKVGDNYSGTGTGVAPKDEIFWSQM